MTYRVVVRRLAEFDLFRDVVETMDLASYFHSATPKSVADLKKWCEDQIIPHGRYRDFVKKGRGANTRRIFLYQLQ